MRAVRRARRARRREEVDVAGGVSRRRGALESCTRGVGGAQLPGLATHGTCADPQMPMADGTVSRRAGGPASAQEVPDPTPTRNWTKRPTGWIRTSGASTSDPGPPPDRRGGSTRRHGRKHHETTVAGLVAGMLAATGLAVARPPPPRRRDHRLGGTAPAVPAVPAPSPYQPTSGPVGTDISVTVPVAPATVAAFATEQGDILAFNVSGGDTTHRVVPPEATPGTYVVVPVATCTRRTMSTVSSSP